MAIIWSEKAIADIEAQTNHIELGRPASAKKLRQVITKTAEYIAHFPNIGREGRRHGTLEYVMPDWPYIIIYQIRKEDVAILAVFHTSLPPGLAFQLTAEK